KAAPLYRAGTKTLQILFQLQRSCVWEDTIMADITSTPTDNTSVYYPYYQAVFEMADIVSVFWQPLLKAIGRSQLEMASLQARQARTMMRWGQQVLQPASPLDLMNTNAHFWQTMTEQYVDVVPRVAAAVTTATQSVNPIVLPI